MGIKQYQLTYPIKMDLIVESSSLKNAVKVCYREYMKISGMPDESFTITNLTDGEMYDFRKKLPKMDLKIQDGGNGNGINNGIDNGVSNRDKVTVHGNSTDEATDHSNHKNSVPDTRLSGLIARVNKMEADILGLKIRLGEKIRFKKD